MQKVLPWVLVIYVACVFLQSLVFKFSGSEETVIIFDTIGDWMAGIGPLSALAEPFRQHGGVAVGVLFFMACGVWVASAITIYLNRPR